ncbi:BRO-N domain-containing protein [Robbsia andropogonis]|uniref:BRO-N domain-containing protein n=1 Tax=Robbsia andropogonis TaxID=28092 RepID=UPI0020A160EA|nr:Bro-N domain-containing protein [Robbsia andropogonis]MCP1116920.1 Bro-N domain-containing protein [Robbsia andropogonis]MCP1126401.1 Bro-N domain-containing protein [Robbsia andropogonis]
MQQVGSAVLVFESTEFDIVDLRGTPWLRSPQISEALGYNQANRIADLYTRNADEFTDDMAQIVELDTAGGRQAVRIFSPRGCYLIGMLARTDRSKAFRRWVLDVLEGRILVHETTRLSAGQRLTALRYRGALAKDLAGIKQPSVATELYANLCYVSRLLGIPVGSLNALCPASSPQQSLI